MYAWQRSQQVVVTPAYILAARRIQFVFGVFVLGFSIGDRFWYTREWHDISSASEIVLQSAAWSSFVTSLTAMSGFFAAKQKGDYATMLLMLDLVASVTSTIASACLIAVAITYWWIDTWLWIATVTSTSTCMITSLLLFARTVQSYLRYKTTTLVVSAHQPVSGIDGWRHAVDQENALLTRDPELSRVSFDLYSDTGSEGPPAPSEPPLSTVAGWTAVSGTASPTQFSEAPPSYRR